MSADLQWMMLRKNSCFLVKSQGVTMSKEPNNLTGKNTFKYSGLVNKKVVGVDAKPNGKGLVMTTKKTKYLNKPDKVMNKVSLTNGSRSSIKTIRSLCRKNHYRADLEDAAVRRACAILRSQRPTAGVQKNRSRRKRN